MRVCRLYITKILRKYEKNYFLVKNRAILKKVKKMGPNSLKIIFQYYKVEWVYRGHSCAKFERNLKKLKFK